MNDKNAPATALKTSTKKFKYDLETVARLKIEIDYFHLIKTVLNLL